MKSLALDASGDLIFNDGDLTFVETKDELMQTIRVLFQTNKNEWFLNPEQGLDYSVVFTKEVDKEVVSYAIEETAMQLDEIESVEDIEINFMSEDRHLEIKFTAFTVEGDEILIEEVL